ncbi:MAG: alpha/beta hydrolase [Polyangiaceae bacterium]|nr:alpha/beta hydrolase [Polyangiaceae bacterium]
MNAIGTAAVIALLVGGCSDADSTEATGDDVGTVTSTDGSVGNSAAGASAMGGSGTGGVSSGGVGTSTTGGRNSSASTGGSVSSAGGSGGRAGGSAGTGGTSGDLDSGSSGRPERPACGNAEAQYFPTPNIEISGRDVVLEAPCGKADDTGMILILNLHGTVEDEGTKLYQYQYFAIQDHIDSHNFIVATPRSVVSQWGNGDGGVDIPHLLDIIDYVYAEYTEYNLQGIWIAGHSWGAGFAKTFACNAAFSDRALGAVVLSGSSGMPSCADRLSVISTIGDSDMAYAGLANQGSTAIAHGCDGMSTDAIGNNTHDFWPNCNAGYVHANYLMLGKGHSDALDSVVVAEIADEIRTATP